MTYPSHDFGELKENSEINWFEVDANILLVGWRWYFCCETRDTVVVNDASCRPSDRFYTETSFRSPFFLSFLQPSPSCVCLYLSSPTFSPKGLPGWPPPTTGFHSDMPPSMLPTSRLSLLRPSSQLAQHTAVFASFTCRTTTCLFAKIFFFLHKKHEARCGGM